MSKERGFLMLELVIGVGVLIAVLAITLKLLQPVVKLQELTRSRAHLVQNQTVVMQRISQQVAIYTRKASIQTGDSDRLVLNDVAGNRIVAFYQAQEMDTNTEVLYMSIQVPPEVAGANQLTDPYNVEVLSFKVYKLDSKRLRVKLNLIEKNSGRVAEFSEVVRLLNGEVL